MKVKLIGVYGYNEAKAVRDLKVGDKIKWNYGYIDEVIDLIPTKTGKSIKVVLKSLDSEYVGERLLRADRLVAIG